MPAQGGATYYYWIANVNTSGAESAKYPASNTGGVMAVIERVDTLDIYDDAVTRAKLAAGAAGKVDSTNIGTSASGSVTVGAATATMLTASFKCTNNATGVTLTLGTKSLTVDFIDQTPFSMTTVESGGGSFSFSKTGGGTYASCELSAVALH